MACEILSSAPSQMEQTSKPEETPLEEDYRVIVNVGGRKFETFKSTLCKFPESTIASKIRFDSQQREFFFDRDPATFEIVLNYFRTGWYPTCSPLSFLEDELIFWGVGEHRKKIRDDIKDFVQKTDLERLLERSLPYHTIYLYIPSSIPKIDWNKFLQRITLFAHIPESSCILKNAVLLKLHKEYGSDWKKFFAAADAIPAEWKPEIEANVTRIIGEIRVDPWTTPIFLQAFGNYLLKEYALDVSYSSCTQKSERTRRDQMLFLNMDGLNLKVAVPLCSSGIDWRNRQMCKEFRETAVVASYSFIRIEIKLASVNSKKRKLAAEDQDEL